jgi:molybdate/tungstate transport system permease protein
MFRKNPPAETTSVVQKTTLFSVVFGFLGIMLLLFILLPLLTTLFGTPWPAIRETLADRETLQILGTTFYAAAWATLLALITGVPLAYLLAHYEFRGKAWIEGLINLPIVIPHTAAGIALLMVFGRQAFLGKILGRLGIEFIDHLPGIVIGMLFVSLPFLVNSARDAFGRVDPELEQAAMAEGASQWQIFFYITLPMSWQGITSGALMMWGRGISEFGAIVILAYHPRVIPILVFERFLGFGLEAAQPVAVILIAASLVVFVLIQVIMRASFNRK